MIQITEGAAISAKMTTPRMDFTCRPTTTTIIPSDLRVKEHLFSIGQDAHNQQAARLDTNSIKRILPSNISRLEEPIKQDEFRSAERFADRQTRKDELIQKLEKVADDHPRVWSVVKAMKSCKAYISTRGGKPHSSFALCKNRHCPVCAAKVREDRGAELEAMAALHLDDVAENKLKHKAHFGLLTLTVRSHEGWSCRNQLDYINRCWSRMIKSPLFKDLAKEGIGGSKSIEIEHNDAKNTWHVHIHCLVQLPQSLSLTDMRAVFAKEWRRRGGGITDFRKVDDLDGSIREVCKYITKGISKSPEVLAQIITATSRKRLYAYWGSWSGCKPAARKKLALDAKKRAEEAEPLVEPSPVNETTGEVADLDQNRVWSFAELIQGVKRGCWTSVYLLRWFKYSNALLRERQWDDWHSD